MKFYGISFMHPYKQSGQPFMAQSVLQQIQALSKKSVQSSAFSFNF